MFKSFKLFNSSEEKISGEFGCRQHAPLIAGAELALKPGVRHISKTFGFTTKLTKDTKVSEN